MIFVNLGVVVIPFYLTVIRLLVPFLILRWPLFGIFASTLADMYDWKFVNIQSDSDLTLYHNWDKVMDLYYWLFALVVVFKFKDKIARKIAFFLFLYRFLGMVLFFFLANRAFLVFFPNVFENFFIFYVAFVHFSKKTQLFKNWKITAAILLSLVIPKLVHEYFMHYLNKQPWEIYNAGEYLNLKGFFSEYTNYAVWGFIFYIVPFLIWVNLVFKGKKLKYKI